MFENSEQIVRFTPWQYRERGAPLVVEDGEADVPVRVNVRVDRRRADEDDLRRGPGMRCQT